MASLWGYLSRHWHLDGIFSFELELYGLIMNARATEIAQAYEAVVANTYRLNRLGYPTATQTMNSHGGMKCYGERMFTEAVVPERLAIYEGIDWVKLGYRRWEDDHLVTGQRRLMGDMSVSPPRPVGESWTRSRPDMDNPYFDPPLMSHVPSLEKPGKLEHDKLFILPMMPSSRSRYHPYRRPVKTQARGGLVSGEDPTGIRARVERQVGELNT